MASSKHQRQKSFASTLFWSRPCSFWLVNGTPTLDKIKGKAQNYNQEGNNGPSVAKIGIIPKG